MRRFFYILKPVVNYKKMNSEDKLNMTELEKLDAGLEYFFFDSEVVARKKSAIEGCARYNAIDPLDFSAQLACIKEILGSTKEKVYINQGFQCDNGKNIHVGIDFLTNFNVTILDIAPVYIGNYVMIGPNTLITTVNHPMTPRGRREKKAIAKAVHIGNDVWIGGNVTILPGVTIGNNVVIAAGAIVTKDVPDNSLVAGIPARVIKKLENDV